MTLSVQNLSFDYDRRAPVLDSLSFTVARGEFIGVFGPNGGGKTTLLKLLVGLLKPTEGQVAAIGKPPNQVSHKIGYVPQVRRFDKQFPISVLEVVLQGRLSAYRGYLNFSREDRAKAMDALERVNLCDLANRPFGQLSGGQIQRTLIARALACQPEILLLDEAMAGVDPEALKEIIDFLLTMKRHITVLLVTHELMGIAPQMDRLFCINRTLTTYTPKEICGHYAMGLYHPPLIDTEGKNV